MQKILLGKHNPYFGLINDTKTIGLGFDLTRFNTGNLLTIQLITLQILFCIPTNKKERKHKTMKKIFNAIFYGIGTFLYMLLFSVGATLAFIECLQARGLYAVGYFIFSLVTLGVFLLYTYYIGTKITTNKAKKRRNT